MTPKKKSPYTPFIYVGIVLLALYVSIQLAAAVKYAEDIGATGGDLYMAAFTYFSDTITNTPFQFTICEHTKSYALYGTIGTIVVLLAITNSKKNYIHGKEFGTARWGVLSDIKPLFADTLMNGEIKLVRERQHFYGRWKARQKVYDKINKSQRKKLQTLISAATLREEERAADGENAHSDKFMRAETQALMSVFIPSTDDDDITRQEEDAIKERVKNRSLRRADLGGEAGKKYKTVEGKKILAEEIKDLTVALTRQTAALKAAAWKPDRLKAQLEKDLRAVDKPQNALEERTDQQKQEEKKRLRSVYRKELSDYYKGTTEIKRIRDKYKNADALFTKTERISIHNYVLNNNTLIMGGSGSGKTRGFVMPNILQAHSSYVVTDPKGEILEKAGHFLSTVDWTDAKGEIHHGYKIRVLNLDNKAVSDGYNPFHYLKPGKPGYEERVLSLIEAMIINTDGGEKKGGSDPFWDKAERLFLQALFFFTSTAFKEESQNMNTVLELISWLDLKEDGDYPEVKCKLDYFADEFAEKFGQDHIGVQQYREFRGKASGKTAKSIVISAVARLAPFRTEAVRRIFSYDSMELDRLGEERMAIFVVVPPTDTTFNFIAGMVFSQMFSELQYCATQVHKDTQRLPVPVRFILDEFANTCKIPNFVEILAYARSFGIGIVTILQSLEQIKNMYEKQWGVIVDNSNTLLYLGSISHMDTLEYMSKLIGKGTFDKRTTGRTRGKTGSSSENFDVVGRDLMDASEIRKLPKKNCLLVVGGKDVFYSEKYDYPSHPNYEYTSDANKALTFVYTPQPPNKEDAVKDTDRLDKPEKPTEITPSAAADLSDLPQITLDMDATTCLSNIIHATNVLPIMNAGDYEIETVYRKALDEEAARMKPSAAADLSDTPQAELSEYTSGLALVQDLLGKVRTYRMTPVANDGGEQGQERPHGEDETEGTGVPIEAASEQIESEETTPEQDEENAYAGFELDLENEETSIITNEDTDLDSMGIDGEFSELSVGGEIQTEGEDLIADAEADLQPDTEKFTA